MRVVNYVIAILVGVLLGSLDAGRRWQSAAIVALLCAAMINSFIDGYRRAESRSIS